MSAIVEFVNTAVDSALAQTRVCMPAKVVKYDAAKQLVDVKPMLQDTEETPDGEQKYASINIIRSVPVAFPSGGGFSITFPIQPGDFVLLVCADSSIDTWLSYGTEAEPFDSRQHSLNDAFAIPGIHPNVSPLLNASSTDMTLGKSGGTASIALKPNGVHLGGADATQPVLKGDAYHSAVSTYLTAIIAALSANGVGPQATVPVTGAVLAGLLATLSSTITPAFETAATASKSLLVKVK